MTNVSEGFDHAGFEGIGDWAMRECAGSHFKDARLGKRFLSIVRGMGKAIGASIPAAFQDWGNTKAAYRFFANDDVHEGEILQGHLQSTADRFSATDGSILVLHDTTEFTYQREHPERIGYTKSVNSGRDKKGRLRSHKVCGVLMHSSLAMTRDGLPLGLAAVKLWTRAKFKGANAQKKKINPTRVPIAGKESVRWLENVETATTLLAEPSRLIHIGDRESDIYELFCKCHDLGTHFLVRTCVDRLAADGTCKVSDLMADTAVKGVHHVNVPDGKGGTDQACLEIRYRHITVQPPIGKQRLYPALSLTVVHAKERGNPKHRKAIDWKLLTDLPVTSKSEALERLSMYAMRWKIEVYHKILKSGCRIETAKLRTAQRLTNFIAICCILAWRVFWMTMINRTRQNAVPDLALTPIEMQLLDHLVKDKNDRAPTKTKGKAKSPPTLSHYIIKIARLGGYLARANDPPPGNMTMWKGLSRLIDIEIGAIAAAEIVGN